MDVRITEYATIHVEISGVIVQFHIPTANDAKDVSTNKQLKDTNKNWSDLTGYLNTEFDRWIAGLSLSYGLVWHKTNILCFIVVL